MFDAPLGESIITESPASSPLCQDVLFSLLVVHIITIQPGTEPRLCAILRGVESFPTKVTISKKPSCFLKA